MSQYNQILSRERQIRMDAVKVTVLCTVYNHEKFLMRCLDGILSQETAFKFELIVNDDASNDSSPEILKKYAARHPQIIKLILQRENQYSKGKSILNEILYPRAQGKYIAVCEGDDYWSDKTKLQKQYDFMEAHSECVMCVHNTIKHDLLGVKKDVPFNKWKDKTYLCDDDVFWGWNVHTSSYFIRKEYFTFPKQFQKYWFGDYIYLTLGKISGAVGYLPVIMSVYNYNNKQGITRQIKDATIEKKIQRILERADYLKLLDSYSEYKYTEIIHARIDDIEFDADLVRWSYLIHCSNNRYEATSYAKKVIHDSRFQKLYNRASVLEKIKLKIKYNGFYVYPLWRRMWNNRFE